MNNGLGLDLKQLGNVASGLDGDARLILKDGQVEQGVQYKGRLAKWIRKTPQSNQEIRASLRNALSQKYDASVVSTVMGNDDNNSKPLTAREAIAKLKQAADLQIQKDLLSVAKERGRIFEVENQLKEIPDIKNQLAELKKEQSKLLSALDAMKTKDGGLTDEDFSMMDRINERSKTLPEQIQTLENKLSRLEQLEETNASLPERKEALSLKDQVLACKSEMVQILGKGAQKIDIEQTIRAGTHTAKLANDYNTQAKQLLQQQDFGGLKALSDHYFEAFEELTGFFNDRIKPGMGKGSGEREHQAVQNIGQQVSRFKMNIKEIVKRSGNVLTEPGGTNPASDQMKKLTGAVKELGNQLTGVIGVNRADGNTKKENIIFRLDGLLSNAKKNGNAEAAQVILKTLDALENNRFEEARLMMESEHIDEDSLHGNAYANLCYLCMLQKAMPESFPMSA